MLTSSYARSQPCSRINPRRYVMGQGMTEYIVILALVVVAAIGVYSYFGKTVRHQVAGIAQEISGQSGRQQLQSATESANAASNRANPEYNLSNYDNATNSGNE